MSEKLIKIYSVILLAGGVYYTVLLLHQYGDIYRSWHSWAHPVYDFSTYSMLGFFYVLAVGTPIVLVLAGVATYRFAYIKWYLAVPLVVLLALSSLIGKVILAAGICIFIFRKWVCATHT